jgi:hypothetical protein
MKIKAVDVNEVVGQTKLMGIVTVPPFSFLLVKVLIVMFYKKGKTCYSCTCARFGVL